jgi:hypothetical protein
LSGPRWNRRRPDEAWVDLRLERHSAGRAAQNDLSRCDAFDAPIVHRLSLAADYRFGADDSKNRQVAPGFDDDPGQPHIREIEIGGLIGVLARRGLASRAEQRALQDRREKLIDARALRSGPGTRFWSSRNGRAGGAVGNVGGQFDKDHGAGECAPGKEQNQSPIDHRGTPPGVSLLRMP